ncbi:hypothetical protein SLEP1_g9782 [Rubroshorea leprosula]|uniref:Pentatricopeptide repeat-containing protein n=1 Tax=Rubroshorea leprosula TaxID=152421 RepID=A0AAV5I5Z3_9ROSI|nr:hypothetical protein SLEP1_g9782 [Rubroshorea leprosula]
MQTSPSLALDPFVFPLVLKSCAAIHRPQLGTSIHAYAIKSAFLLNPFVACALVDMYGKCGSVSAARQLFDEIPLRNVVAWNAMISIYTHFGRVNDALELFESMDVVPNESSFNAIMAGLVGLENGAFRAMVLYRRMQECGLKPNLITLLALLPACVGVAALSLIKEVHCYAIRNGMDPNIHMRERDVVAWSSLISAYALHGEARTALEIFRQMEMARVWPDDITFLGVLKACSHAGLADEALYYLDRMHKDYGMQASADHYSCLVDALSRAGRLLEAYKVIQEMPLKATAKTWGALLGACRTYGEVELAEIAGRALFEIEPNNAANYVLLEKIYASLGRYEEAERMRREMKERGVKSAPGSSWIVHQD